MRLASRSTYLGLVSGVHVCLSIDEQFHQLLVTPGSCTIHWCPQYCIPERGDVREGEREQEKREGESRKGGREGEEGREGGRERKGEGKKAGRIERRSMEGSY